MAAPVPSDICVGYLVHRTPARLRLVVPKAPAELLPSLSALPRLADEVAAAVDTCIAAEAP
jgi:hypothetical protein